MEFYLALILIGVTAGCSLALVPIASHIAKTIGLVDKPSSRKLHQGEVPLAGGMVLIAGVWCGAFFIPQNLATWGIVMMSLPMFLLGAVDDRFDIPARIRIFIQVLIGALLVFLFDVKIEYLDGFISDDQQLLGPVLAVGFTLMCCCGVLNAVNMSDGIDGLLGSVSSISLAVIALLAINANAQPEAYSALLVLGLLIGYLAYNLGFFGQGRKVFLGDSGSTVVGLVLLVLLIELSQGDNPVITPTSAGWLLGLPLLDTVSVMVRRVSQKRSPFSAGRDHFHHLLQDFGLSRKTTLNVMITLQFAFVAVGVIANQSSLPQYYFLWAFVVLTVTQFFAASAAARVIGKGSITATGLVRQLDEG